jgi:hypothetical protein
MKKLKFKSLAILFAAFLVMSCSSARYANTGTASDRTGTNGATNGTGKAPAGTAHQQTNKL